MLHCSAYRCTTIWIIKLPCMHWHNMFIYIRPVKCNVKMLKVRKSPENVFEPQKTNIIIPLWTSYYMPQNPQKSISKTSIMHYNQFRSVRTEV